MMGCVDELGGMKDGIRSPEKLRLAKTQDDKQEGLTTEEGSV
jgi:hypothetical protein